MKSYRFGKFLIMFWVVLAFSGCRDTSLELAVRYSSLGELKPDSSVYVEQTRVGHIEKIVSSDQGDYLVKIAVEPDYKNRVTEYSRFLLSEDPLNSDNAAIVIEQSRAGGKLLESGSIVKGEQHGIIGTFLSHLQQTSNHASKELQISIAKMKQAFAQGSKEFSSRLDEAVGEIGRSLDELQESWRSGAAQDDLKEMQENLDRFIEEFQHSGAEVQKKIREDIIPEIKKQLQDLERKMRQENRDSEADQVERHVDEITRI